MSDPPFLPLVAPDCLGGYSLGNVVGMVTIEGGLPACGLARVGLQCLTPVGTKTVVNFSKDLPNQEATPAHWGISIFTCSFCFAAASRSRGVLSPGPFSTTSRLTPSQVNCFSQKKMETHLCNSVYFCSCNL